MPDAVAEVDEVVVVGTLTVLVPCVVVEAAPGWPIIHKADSANIYMAVKLELRPIKGHTLRVIYRKYGWLVNKLFLLDLNSQSFKYTHADPASQAVLPL